MKFKFYEYILNPVEWWYLASTAWPARSTTVLFLKWPKQSPGKQLRNSLDRCKLQASQCCG